MTDEELELYRKQLESSKVDIILDVTPEDADWLKKKNVKKLVDDEKP
ncbi:MAG: hypothetical protein ACR2G6_01725 [Gemmatimonadaceae bacterium]